MAVTGEAGVGKSSLLAAVHQLPGRIELVGATAHESQWRFAGLQMLLDQSGLSSLGETVRQHVGFSGSSTNFDVATIVVRNLRDFGLSPTLLLIDDAELLDDDSKQVIGSIIRRIRGSNLRIVLAMESNDCPGPFSGLPELRLDPLSLKDSMTLAKVRCPPDSDLGILRAVAHSSGGVPAIIVELLGTLNKSSLDGTDPLTLPFHLGGFSESLAMARVRNLEDTALQQMRLLSCAHMTRLEAMQWLFPEGTTSLEALIATGFVRSSGAMLHIQSPQLRSALYWSMAPSDRTEAHTRLSEVLRMSDHAAHLWHESFVNPTADVAYQLKKAALEHFGQGAIQCGFEELERSRSLAEGDAQDWLLFQEAASVLLEQGEVSLAARYEQAMTRTGALMPMPTQAMLGLRLDFLIHARVSVARYEALARGQGSTQAPEVAYVFSTAAYYLAQLGSMNDARSFHLRAIAMFPPAGSRADAMCKVMAYFLAEPGAPQTRKPKDIQRFLTEISILGSNHARILLAQILSLAEDYEVARALLDSVLARGPDTTVMEHCVAMLARIENEYRAGGHHVAIADAKQLAGLDMDPHLLTQGNALIQVWNYLDNGENLMQGQAFEVLHSLNAPTNGQIVNASFHAILGRTYLDHERFQEALVHLERGLELSASWPFPHDLRIGPDLVEAYIRLNQTAKARNAYEEFAQGSKLHPTRWSEVVLPRCRALVLEGEPSLDAFQVAEDAWHSGDSEYERTRTLRAYAHRLVALGENEKADLKLPFHGQDFVKRLPPEANAADSLVPHVDRRVALLNTLSEAHREVVVLALDGLKNREIAKQVHLTVRGVESRLSAVYERLGVTNRAELFSAFSGCGPSV